MKRHSVARELARGLFSGLVATAVMTAVQKLEAKRSGEEPSKTPAKAVEKVLDVEPESEAEEMKLATATHWAYGTSWGIAKPLIGLVTRRPVTATTMHFLAVWGAGLANLTLLGLAPPPTQWKKKTLAKDFFYHAVYAATAGIAYELSGRWLGARFMEANA